MAFPAEWGARGSEGVVVQFDDGATKWVGNFRPGVGGVTFAATHPNGHNALVAAKGDLWSVDVSRRTAAVILQAVVCAIDVSDPIGWVFDRQGLALARLGPRGFLWHTRRLSFDGIKDLRIEGPKITGRAWQPAETWDEFEVDLRTGSASGGSYHVGNDEWEQFATDIN
jgi:hypothetical protein